VVNQNWLNLVHSNPRQAIQEASSFGFSFADYHFLIFGEGKNLSLEKTIQNNKGSLVNEKDILKYFSSSNQLVVVLDNNMQSQSIENQKQQIHKLITHFKMSYQ
jgi:sugar diacid utilization regulator